MNCRGRWVGVVIWACLGCALPASSQAGLLINWNYEAQTLHEDTGASRCCTTDCPHSWAIASTTDQGKTPDREGLYFLRQEVHTGDSGRSLTDCSGASQDRYRSEARLLISGGTLPAPPSYLERWYGFSVYIDSTWDDNSTDPNGTILFQWKRNPDSGCEDLNPIMNLHILPSGTWRLRTSYTTVLCETRANSALNRVDTSLGALALGQWHDFVFHIRWAWDSNGILQVWHNRALVIDQTGPNVYRQVDNAEYIQFGVYKSWWKFLVDEGRSDELPSPPDELIVYHDAIRVGDGTSSYAEVAPRFDHFQIPGASITSGTIAGP